MSRSSAKNDSYHHGDLRNALIAAGITMLTEQGEHNLSLRKLARAAGVSHNAPYMHFADKEALLAAIAEEGFALLSAEVDGAIGRAGADWQAQLHGAAWAYVQFALNHPGYFNVMFRYYDPAKYPGQFSAATGALALLRQLVAAGQGLQLVAEGDSLEIAATIWSMLHGIATILAGRKMPPVVQGSRTPEALVRDFVEQLYLGLANS